MYILQLKNIFIFLIFIIWYIRIKSFFIFTIEKTRINNCS